MSNSAPSDRFLFFKPSLVFESFILPGYFIIFFGAITYSRRSLTYALFVSPNAYWLLISGWIIASFALSLIMLNVYWAYEGNYFRWQSRPWKHFDAGNKWWCAYKHAIILLLCMAPLFTHFMQVLPHRLLLYKGTSEVSELVVLSKGKAGSRSKRPCYNLVEASSTEYRSDRLCLKSDQLYSELEVGDTLIVEGKANWIGLLVDRTIAVRDAESGLKRSVSECNALSRACSGFE